MSKDTMRAHVVIPREILERVDRLVGRRGRSKFLVEAAEEKMARLRLSNAARRAVGTLVDVEVPGWETSQSSVEWVAASRRADTMRLQGSEEA